MFHKEETFNQNTMMVQDNESIKKVTVFGQTFVPFFKPIFTKDEMDALLEAESAYFYLEIDLNTHSSFKYV